MINRGNGDKEVQDWNIILLIDTVEKILYRDLTDKQKHKIKNQIKRLERKINE